MSWLKQFSLNDDCVAPKIIQCNIPLLSMEESVSFRRGNSLKEVVLR